MIRVLMTTDTVGGVWTYSLELIRALAEFRVEVDLATMGRPMTREQRRAVRRLNNVEVFESSFRLEWMDDPWRDIGDAREWLLRLESETNPDVVHLNQFCFGQLPWKTRTLMVSHSDVLSWYRHVKKQTAPAEWNRYRAEVTDGVRSCSSLVCPSRAVEQDMRDSFGISQSARVIPNGSSFEKPADVTKEPFVLSVGRVWDEAKNISALDQIAPRLSFPVKVAGSRVSPDGSRIDLQSVELVGELSSEQLAQYFARAAIYALPAKYEPFGLTVLEAATSGCALVLGDIPSLRENWQHAAVFVDPSDSEQLFSTLQSLMNDESGRQKLGSQARERSRFFSGKRMASSYYQEYRALERQRLPLSQDQFVPSQKEV